MRFEAGVENLGRATCQKIDALIVVVEPGRRSAQTAATIRRMAREIGIQKIFVVANKVRSPRDIQLLRQELPDDVPLLGTLSYNDDLMTADLEGRPVEDAPGQLFEEAQAIRLALMRELQPGRE